MTIGRRQVVGWGALGLGAFAMDGCGAFPWGKTPSSAQDVEPMLLELDRLLAQLETLEPDTRKFGITPGLPHEHEGRDAAIRLLTSVCCLGTYRDVPESVWEQPSVARRLARTLPEIRDTLAKARGHIASLTDEQAQKVDARFQKDPDMPMRIMERVDEYANKLHVPIEQRAYLRTATAQLSGKFRYEGTKEVTSKLLAKFDRAYAARKASLGMEGETEDAGGGGEVKKTDPEPVRAQFKTRATPTDVHTATCDLKASVSIDGSDRPILLDWEEFRCASTVKITDDHPPIHGAVHTEVTGDDKMVTVVLYPPAGTSSEILSQSVTQIAKELERRLSLGSGTACNISADCTPPLRCVAQVCRNPNGPTPPTSKQAQSRLGQSGDSCRTGADCEGTLSCQQNVCRTPDDRRSARLLATTGKIAKWGAILLIPPICAVGILVLLTCFFMVIVAGIMQATGD
jgi:hypothetical protein